MNITITKETVASALADAFKKPDDGKNVAIAFANKQPNLALALLQKYGYIPKTALFTYLTVDSLTKDEELPLISDGVLADVLEDMASNKEAFISKFVSEQPLFTEMLKEGYGYVPSTAPLVFFSLQKQMSHVADEFAKFMEATMNLTDDNHDQAVS